MVEGGVKKRRPLKFYNMVKLMSLHDQEFQKKLRGTDEKKLIEDEDDVNERAFIAKMMKEPSRLRKKRSLIFKEHQRTAVKAEK